MSTFGSPFYHVLGFHNSFLYISNFTDISIVVQKIISWKAGEPEAICLHGGLRLCRLCIGRMAKNFRADLSFQKQKSAIHVARLTIHEIDVRNCPYFPDKLVEDWRWQKR